MTDRDLLIGLFNAFGSYVQRKTGVTFVLCIKDNEGYIHHVYPNTDLVTWFNAEGEVVSPGVGLAEYSGMRCSLHGELNDNGQEPLLTDVTSANYLH